MKCVMSEEEFLLKWNNHQSNFVDVFNELLRDESFVDVTLVCGGEAVPGHKMVLAACSPLLHRILRDNPCKHPLVILGDVPARDMRAMMKFIYQGEVSVSQSELASFLKTADNLQIKGLAEDKEKEKEDKKRKDKDSDRVDGRPNSKRQRTSDSRIIDCSSPLPARSHKSLNDSHSSSHKNRSRNSTDDQPLKGGGRGGGLHAPASKHNSSKNSSSKPTSHDIPSKVSKPSEENDTRHVNSNNGVDDDVLPKEESVDELTVKTEPLDYPGEMVWTEGHGTINSDTLDDAQGLLPLVAIPGALEGVAAAMGVSANLPIIEFGEDSRNDDGSRGDMSTASDDINANTAGDLEDGDDENATTGSPGKFRGGRKACCFCGKTFCDNYTLRRHMVTHLSRERQFECPMCSAAYSRKDHLMAHIRRKHPIADDVEKLDFGTGQAS
ncbi:broad-complex core protein isoforms 1/2/3/4/5 isoform X2 [Procambarus clarkii]|uniref:broad-complex core protein isoforms 1/2/3/4/5 isoform X2 n=1 Tax=Procambarus clarkii TaxID=6728 RepID=UPI001E676E63|nr:broad-complex core protein isoforms 1/2/3/4/5-like isoform X3 [Procambarus clarkii]